MKKRLLFVMPSLDAGGGEKSLVNLLGVMDYSRYDVDLMLFHKTGIFIKMLPSDVNVMEIGGDFINFRSGLIKSTVSFLKKFKLGLAAQRILFALKNRIISNKSHAEQSTWSHSSNFIPKLEKHYDVAVGFLEKSSVYYVVDKVIADKKIGWIHTNYSNSGMKKEFDAPYFNQLDHIVAVSDECGNGISATFPNLKNKVRVIHNIVSEEVIRNLAVSGQAPELIDGKINIVSVGRLSHEKGFDIAVDACNNLIKEGTDVQWFVIGDGNQRAILESKIQNLKLEKNFHLLGLRDNPYAYVEKAIVYVQPSRYEGKSIAIDEAKILQKPIVVTNFATADQITNRENGVVTDMNAESLAIGIQAVLNENGLRNILVSNLQNEHLGTSTEIMKLYELIENK